MGHRGLDPNAYRELQAGERYRPYVDDAGWPRELSARAVVAGILFGILFGAANAYLGLRSGLTISTSIPVAVLTVAFFRVLRASGASTGLLEANLSQTIGSASSSVASGVIFTLPALFLWGLDPSLLQMTLLAMSGGLLGVMFMVPLRRLLIEGEHGRLPYPEGTACAEVLVASDVGGASARPVFAGLGMGVLVRALTGLFHVVPDAVRVRLPLLPKAEVATEVSAALFGVGYILGPWISAVMVGGALLSWVVLIPAIALWAGEMSSPLYPETVKTIAEMAPAEIWTRYVRYIGAGAVATGGLATLVRSIPTMRESFSIGARELRSRLGEQGAGSDAPRTGLDLDLTTVLRVAVLVVAVLAFTPWIFSTLPLVGRIVAAVLVGVFAFFFVTVSSRIVGLVGVTSNPTSGMTIASLLGTSMVFFLAGWTDDVGKVSALLVGCVVAIAASIAGDTSQDLKTGFLLGATPRRQQLGEVVGVLTSAVFVCMTLILLDGAYGFGTAELPAPQATLMKLVIEGVLEASLPWAFVGIGVVLALLAEIAGLPSLAFAVGIYLPVATMVPVFLGGSLRWWLERTAPTEQQREQRRERGVLLGSGLVGGTGLFSVVLAGTAVWLGRAPVGFGTDWAGSLAPFVGVATILLMVLWFARGATAGARE